MKVWGNRIGTVPGEEATAANIAIAAIEGLQSGNVQEALAEIKTMIDSIDTGGSVLTVDMDKAVMVPKVG